MIDKNRLPEFSSVHLPHELTMLRWTAVNVEETTAEQHDAILESWVIHLRNLINFFYRPGRPTDATAADFFDDPSTWKPAEPDELTKARDRAEKEISHITDQRKPLNDPNRGWDVKGLTKTIWETASRFANHPSARHLSPELKALFEGGDFITGLSVATQATVQQDRSLAPASSPEHVA